MSTKFKAPIEANIEVWITDGKRNGKVTVGLGVGDFPTEEKIREAIESLKTSEELPAGFHVMTKREWWDALCAEKFGERFAMPGGSDWDV
jgi:hypothetical protein